METQQPQLKNQTKTPKLNKKNVIVGFSVFMAVIAIITFFSSGNKKSSSTNIPEETQSITKNEQFIPVPGDEVFLRYDKETDEKIYVVDTLENYNALKDSFNIKDNEARYKLILSGNVVAVENGTKVRILDYADKSGGEKVRVLEGKDYNFTGYVPWSLLKKD